MNVFDLLINDKEAVAMADVFLANENDQILRQLIKEHRYIEKLNQYGLPANHKILLQGSSGCGKTTTAKAIAHALGKPILILNLSNVVSSRIGETSQHLKLVFDKAAKEKAVLFLDEFDQIGKARDNGDKEVGEMRRLVNTLIQLIDYYPSSALLICATNHPEIIDTALLRRFQLSLNFELPSPQVLDQYYNKLLAPFPMYMQQVTRKYAISFAEAKDQALTQVKSLLLDELEKQERIGNG